MQRSGLFDIGNLPGPGDDHNDHGTETLLREILVSEEEHADWLETQLGLIAQIGEANYLAQQINEG